VAAFGRIGEAVIDKTSESGLTNMSYSTASKSSVKLTLMPVCAATNLPGHTTT
jgi:hypothetical protein